LTLYLFLVDEEANYLSGEQPSAARIDALRRTWRDADGYADLVSRLMEAPQEVVQGGEAFIVINDDRVYTSADEFRSSDARLAYEMSVQTRTQLDELQGQLDAMRQEWHTATTAQRTRLRPQIVRMESQEQQLRAFLAQQELKYRNLENAAH
jgi:hypothetical protein